MWDLKKSVLKRVVAEGSSRRDAPARGGAGASGEVSPTDGRTIQL
jgi:hypothetical protein